MPELRKASFWQAIVRLPFRSFKRRRVQNLFFVILDRLTGGQVRIQDLSFLFSVIPTEAEGSRLLY